jgi:hypothetical protein
MEKLGETEMEKLIRREKKSPENIYKILNAKKVRYPKFDNFKKGCDNYLLVEHVKTSMACIVKYFIAVGYEFL